MLRNEMLSTVAFFAASPFMTLGQPQLRMVHAAAKLTMLLHRSSPQEGN